MRRNSRYLIALVLSGTCGLAAPLRAQAIDPDPAENKSTKSGCLGTAKQILERGIQVETFMTSAVNLSPVALTATLPLHKGYFGPGTSSPVYYILTDASDCATAKALGINYSPKLALLVDSQGEPVNKSVQKVTVDGSGAVHFAGTVTFRPNVRIFAPSTASTPNALDPTADGPQGFPPSSAAPGSVGDANYTPLITYTDSHGRHIVLNATQVANATGVKDFIPEIDFDKMTVTFNVVNGIYNFHFVLYLRMDASDPLISGFEGGIYAPNLELAPINGERLIENGSARQVIIPVLNGIRGVDQIFNRQGVQSSAIGEGDPFNITGSKAGEDETYSPLWDLTPAVWTPASVDTGRRQRLHQDDEVKNFVQAGLVQSWDVAQGAVNSDIGLQSLDIVSNCPIMMRVLEGLPTFPPKR